MENNKQVFLSLETARQMYKSNDSAVRQFALDNYKKEELEAKELPMNWEELVIINGVYIDSNSSLNVSISRKPVTNNRNVFPTESLAKGALALAQLLQLRNAWNEGIIFKWDINLSNEKHCIYLNNESKSFEIHTTYTTNQLFHFKNKVTAEKFLATFKELLWEAREFI